jgi:hypothetical protein
MGGSNHLAPGETTGFEWSQTDRDNFLHIFIGGKVEGGNKIKAAQ